MYTIVESDTFKKAVKAIWTEDERLAFFSYIAQSPLAGDVVPGTGGLRKVRWQAAGHGKRGGARVIYYNLLEQGEIRMYYIYQKNEVENLSTKALLDFMKE